MSDYQLKLHVEKPDTPYTNPKSCMQRRDPLALDLDGDGIETTSSLTGNVIVFDHDADGVKTGTGWLKPDDGWLVLDRNGNGSIDSGRELFGVDTLKRNGQLASDGFDALRDMDANQDGRIDGADSVFANLRIWRDLNQDGISQANELSTLSANSITRIGVNASAVRNGFGELLTLSQAGVQNLNVGYTNLAPSTAAAAQGNQHQQLASFTNSGGSFQQKDDFWFSCGGLTGKAARSCSNTPR